MNTSEKTDQIAPALVAALGKMKNPKKDATANAGKYAYSYLTLPELTEYVRSALEKVGLVATQEVTDVEGATGILTRIWHLSGQWIEFGPCVMHSGSAAQERGSATSYARRYALAAAVGLAPEEDDDGAKASRRPDSTQARVSGTGAAPVDRATEAAPPSSAGDQTTRGGAPVESQGTEGEVFGEGAEPSVSLADAEAAYGGKAHLLRAARLQWDVRSNSELTDVMLTELMRTRSA